MKLHSVPAGFFFFAAVLFSSATPAQDRLHEAKTFCFGLGADTGKPAVLEALKDFDLVVIDGEYAGRSEVSALKSAGVIVLAYLSVGSIEKGRKWYKRVKRYRLDHWDDWDEWYADTSKKGYRDIIAKNVTPSILKKGFDGLFLDNVDMVESHRRQKAGMYRLVSLLSALVHRKHGYLFTQNGNESAASTMKYLDGWNHEDVTSTYNFDSKSYEKVPAGDTVKILEALKAAKARGKVVTTADYTAAGDTETDALSIANACSVGALPYISNIYLTRIPSVPFQCP